MLEKTLSIFFFKQKTAYEIALTHPPPRRPPGEKIFVIRIERAPNVHQPLRQKPLEYFPLIGPLAAQIRISLLRMNVPLAAGDVDVSTDNESRAARVYLGNVPLHLAQEFHFGREIFAAVGNIDGGYYQTADLGRNDAGLIVKG